MTMGTPSTAERSRCFCCPRGCGAARTAGDLGYCRTGAGFPVAAIVRHRGEEPVLSGTNGICNVFFAHCNLQCLFCQNHQISRNSVPEQAYRMELGDVVGGVGAVLDSGVRAVGFVSPSHCIPQTKSIIAALRESGRNPVFVFNTNAYDRRETIRSLEGLIDVYLPDLKYMDADLARRYSQAADYPQVATAALREMFRQKGSNLAIASDGIAKSGLIIRHMILPGHVENSKACLQFIAEELSPAVHISLMAQYYPIPAIANHPDLGRCVRREEYEEVLEEFYRLGFYRGWIQDLESQASYRPDFDRANVFEGEPVFCIQSRS